MVLIQRILGAGDDGAVKLIGLLVVGAIWVIGAMINWANKKAQQSRQEQLRQKYNLSTPPAPTNMNQQVPMTRQLPLPPPIPRVSRQRPPRIPRQTMPARQVVPAPEAPAQPVAEKLAPARPVATAAPVQRRPTVTAPALHRWLTPATLRQQFIITEIFQPPLSLRERRDLV